MPEYFYPSLQDVLETHQAVLERFGGVAGVRDMGLLESALAQPQLEVFGRRVHETLELQAAAYLFHLLKNHPFVDGNKRTALTVALSFLAVNGFGLALGQEALFGLVLDVANDLEPKDNLARRLAAVIQPVGKKRGRKPKR